MKDSMCFLVMCGVLMLSACTGDITPTQPVGQPEVTLTSSPAPSPTITSTATPQPTRTREPTATLPPDIEPLVSEGWGIYLVEPDGENLQRLTESGKNYYRYLQFSPDGVQIAFIEEGKENPESLIVYRLDSQEMETLFAADGDIVDFAWTPDSERIAVLVQAEENVAYLSLFNLESRTLEELLEWDGRLTSVSWSYDGRYLAFAGSEPALDFTPSMDERVKTEVYVFDTLDGQLTQLTSSNGLSFAPEWSPTEYALAYEEKKTDSMGALLQLIYPFETDNTPAEIDWILSYNIVPLIWSPDGEQIAYGESTGARIVNIHDGISSGLAWGFALYFPTSWSPDGRMVLVEVLCCDLVITNIVDTEKIGATDPNELSTRLLESKMAQNRMHIRESQWSPVEDLIVFTGRWISPIP